MTQREELPVSVKALEWSEHQAPNKACGYDHVTAQGAFRYSIEWKSWKKYDAFAIHCDGEFVLSDVSLEAAKAAAQADYETRVLSALVASPVGQLGGSAEDLRNVLCGVIELFGIEGAADVTSYALKHRGTNAFDGSAVSGEEKTFKTCERCKGGGEIVSGWGRHGDRIIDQCPDCSGVEINFGLEAQGHIPKIKAMIHDGRDWPFIGRAIGWDGETAKTYYERYLARQAALSAKEGN